MSGGGLWCHFPWICHWYEVHCEGREGGRRGEGGRGRESDTVYNTYTKYTANYMNLNSYSLCRDCEITQRTGTVGPWMAVRRHRGWVYI